MDFLFYKTQIEQCEKGFIYVVEVDGNYKIGRSITPKIRFGEYTRLYKEPKTICCEYVSNYLKMEKELHNLFADKRIRGEWFDLQDKDIIKIKNILTENKATIKCEETEKKVLIKDKKVKINENNFVKVMKNEQVVVDILKDCPTTYYALNFMKRYILKGYNLLLKKGKKYKATDLAQDLGITRQMATIHIRNLKEKNIIKTIYTDSGAYFAINPNYYCKGEEISSFILEQFDKAKK